MTFNHLTTDDGLSQFSVNSLYNNDGLFIGKKNETYRKGEDSKSEREEESEE